MLFIFVKSEMLGEENKRRQVDEREGGMARKKEVNKRRKEKEG